MSVSSLAWKFLPVSALKPLVRAAGSFRARERLGLVLPPWYAYGVLRAADHAAKVGVSSIWALEFGVAAGRGLRRLRLIGDEVSRLTGVKIRIAGFDTGAGMLEPSDYRDHPEKYRAGDYAMQDMKMLQAELGSDVNLVIGDIAETIASFRDSLEKTCPVGFVAVDVDVYTAAKAALQLFSGDPECYLPFTFSYFDDITNSHFNKFCGELLAIEEFNNENDLRKIDLDRGVWLRHKLLGPQTWYERMYVTHIFDHPWRFQDVSRPRKNLPES